MNETTQADSAIIAADADVHEVTRAVLCRHGQFAGSMRATTVVRGAVAPGSPAAAATIEQVTNAVHALVRAGQAAPYGRGGWQWAGAVATFPARYLTIDPPGDRFAAPIYAGEASKAHLYLVRGSYSGHYSDHRRTNAPVLATLDEAGTGLLMLACGQCPPTFDVLARPIHRGGCPGR